MGVINLYLILESILVFIVGMLTSLIKNDFIKCNKEAKDIANFIFKAVPIIWIVAIFLDPLTARLINIPVFDNFIDSLIGNSFVVLMFYFGYSIPFFKGREK